MRADHYTADETADRLGVSLRTVRRMAKSGRLHKVWRDGELFFRRGQVDQMLRESRGSRKAG